MLNWYKMAAFTRLLNLISLVGLVYTAEQCNGPRQLPTSGMMLQKHIYDTRFARSGYAECLHVCREENACQSFNFVMSKSMCEFNNRTKEAYPEDYVPNADRYYVKLDVSRVQLGSIPGLPAKSCKEIKNNEGGQAESKKYWFYSIIPGTTVLAPCDMRTDDIDECSASPAVCHADASCQNNVGSYVCTCHSGFTGNGKSCSDIDECRASPAVCHADASCQNNVGSYVCTCHSGFTGNGKSCSDIDECRASPAVCHADASCQNNVGSYVCTCHSGFTGNGKSCSDVDECAGNSHGCHVNAHCTNTKGSYNCACKSSYHGNGKYCVYKRGLYGSSSILGSVSYSYLDQLISYLNPVLQNSARSRFVRCWRAQSNGWAASTFHSYCDGRGPTVTIIKVGSYIFGGYTDKSWSNSSGWTSSSKAFIYSLYNIYRYSPVKRELKLGNTQQYAIYRGSGLGPTFGPDIRISDNAASNNGSYTYCGHTYHLPPGYSSSGYSCTFYAGSYHFKPTDVEVFYETTA